MDGIALMDFFVMMWVTINLAGIGSDEIYPSILMLVSQIASTSTGSCPNATAMAA